MIIELPKKFERNENRYSFARIRDGVLEIKGDVDFEKLMVELTYALKGRTQCYYCRQPVHAKKITIDHLYPSDFGGVTITNNLEPACYKCNSSKSNMNQFEFNVWRTINSKEEQKAFYHRTVARKKRLKKDPKVRRGYDLPRKWVKYIKLEYVHKISKTDNRGSEKFKRMFTFARRYKKLPRPIVISSNYILLDGETAYAVAKDLHFVEVPVIILENVVVLRWYAYQQNVLAMPGFFA